MFEKRKLKKLSVDETLVKLGECCEKLGLIRSDKSLGMFKTLSREGQVHQSENSDLLVEVAAEKLNVVPEGGFYKTLDAIASAAEAQGHGQSAAKIRAYVEMINRTDKRNKLLHGGTLNPVKYMKNRLKAAKNKGPLL